MRIYVCARFAKRSKHQATVFSESNSLDPKSFTLGSWSMCEVFEKWIEVALMWHRRTISPPNQFLLSNLTMVREKQGRDCKQFFCGKGMGVYGDVNYL